MAAMGPRSELKEKPSPEKDMGKKVPVNSKGGSGEYCLKKK